MSHHFLICGIRYAWRYVKLRGGAEGWAYVGGEKPKILIDSRLKRRARLETECHEFLHAANPTLSEDHVHKQAHDLAKVLWTLGYRLVDSPPESG